MLSDEGRRGKAKKSILVQTGPCLFPLWHLLSLGLVTHFGKFLGLFPVFSVVGGTQMRANQHIAFL